MAALSLNMVIPVATERRFFVQVTVLLCMLSELIRYTCSFSTLTHFTSSYMICFALNIKKNSIYMAYVDLTMCSVVTVTCEFILRELWSVCCNEYEDIGVSLC
jgi:hypothetical protein